MEKSRITIESHLAEKLGEVPLDKVPLMIGRDSEQCDITLENDSISPQQACIEHDGKSLIIKAISYGTYVNGKHLLPKEGASLPLSAGDMVSMSGFRLRIKGSVFAGKQKKRANTALMRRFSELKAAYHEELLTKENLKSLSTQSFEEDARRKEIEQALNEILDNQRRIDPELIEFIVLESVGQALLDQLFSDQKSRPGTFGTRNLNPLERVFEETVDDCAHLLGVKDKTIPLDQRIAMIDEKFEDVFESRWPAMNPELRSYLVTRAIRRDLSDLVFGLGPLEDLLRMPDLTEIMVVGRKKIFVEKSGRLEETGRMFPNDDNLEVVINRIVAPISRVVNRSQPLCDARLADGSRVNIAVPPVSIDGPSITIRKFQKDPFTIEALINFGTLNRHAANFLRGCVRSKKNIIVSGGTGTGKTTLLNTLSREIPKHERIVVVEDAAELQLHQRNLVVLEARRKNIEGKGEITIRDLVRNALRMRPDRIVVGECRGGEALDMLQAMNTGHDGSLTTAHANSPREMMSRLEVLVLSADESMPIMAIDRQIVGAIDLVIQIARMRDRSRRITHITEVCGYDAEEKEILLEDVFRLFEFPEKEPVLRFTGYLPSFIEEMLANGDVVLNELLERDEEAA